MTDIEKRIWSKFEKAVCPHCKGRDINPEYIDVDPWEGTGYWEVSCGDCGAVTDGHRFLEGAMDQWNKGEVDSFTSFI